MTPQRLSARVVDPFDWSTDDTSILATAPLPGLPSDAPAQYALTLWPLAAAPQAETAVKVLASDKAFNIWQGNILPRRTVDLFQRSEPGRARRRDDFRDPERRR